MKIMVMLLGEVYNARIYAAGVYQFAKRISLIHGSLFLCARFLNGQCIYCFTHIHVQWLALLARF